MPRTKFASDDERKQYYRERSARNYAANPDRANAYTKKWRAENPDVVKTQWNNYYEQRKPEMQKRGRDYYHATKERTRERLRAIELAAPGTLAARRRHHAAKNPERCLWNSAKQTAKRKNLPFNIEVSDIVIPERCPVFGFPLERNTGKAADTSPSIDKIIPALGYVKGNITIVSWRANRFKSNATVTELQQLAAFYSQFSQ